MLCNYILRITSGGVRFMYSMLIDFLFIVIVLNLFALALLVIFLWNARINLRRQVEVRRFIIITVNAAKTAHSSEAAAAQLNISLNEFLKYCKDKGIETPEERKEKRDRIQKKKEEQERKMMEDEAAWHAEQQKIDDKRHKEIEEEAKKRKQRLQKFGFK